jgi:hypothetical protein
MVVKYNGFNSSLNLCDIMQKYNLKNVYNIPKIRLIVITLTLNNVLNNTEKKLTREELETYSVYLVFILQLRFPKIVIDRSRFLNGYNLKIFLRNNTEITLFNDLFCTEVFKSITLLNKQIKFKKDKKVFHITSENFPEIKKVFTSNFFKLNVQPFDVRIEFRLSDTYLNGMNVLYSLPYFWTFK